LGAIVQVPNDIQGFQERRKIEDGKRFIYMGNDDKAPVK